MRKRNSVSESEAFAGDDNIKGEDECYDNESDDMYVRTDFGKSKTTVLGLVACC